MTILHFRRNDGSAFRLYWDPSRCLLLDERGAHLRPSPELARHAREAASPRSQDARVHGLRLKLGDACNARCAYCIQGGHSPLVRPDHKALDTLLARITLQCDRDPYLNSFTFWGGEPLLYYPAIQTLTAGILRLRPGATFGLTTNGLLLDEAKADFLLEHRFVISISHDGPGQGLRGPDPLAGGSASRRATEKLLAAAPDHFSVNPIFARGNPGQRAVLDWFTARFGSSLRLGEACPCWPVDEASARCAMPEADLPAYAARFLADLNDPAVYGRYPVYRHAVHLVLRLLDRGQPLGPEGSCSAWRLQPAAVDMAGRALVCHNAGPDHTFTTDMSNTRGLLGEDLIPLDLPGWQTRGGGRCRTCPVLPLCRGGCPMVDDAMWEKQCPQRYWHNLPLLAVALSLVTDGGLLTAIEPAPAL